MVRAVRLAATHELAIEAATLAAIAANAGLVEHLSGERVGAEVSRLLEARHRRSGCGSRWTRASWRWRPGARGPAGHPQNKVPGEDLWDHTLRTVDAAPAARPIGATRGPPARPREAVHAGRRPVPSPRRRGRAARGCPPAPAPVLADDDRGRDAPRRPPHVHGRPRRLGRGDPAVHPAHRTSHVEALFELRRADDIGSGVSPTTGDRGLPRPGRCPARRAPPSTVGALAVDGDDLIRELGLDPGPRSAACSTRCSSGWSSIQRSTTAPT